jgi:hypothetical protein
MSSTTNEEMYLDWFNNFLSIEKFKEYYNLSMVEAENVIDQGRKINQKQ